MEILSSPAGSRSLLEFPALYGRLLNAANGGLFCRTRQAHRARPDRAGPHGGEPRPTHGLERHGTQPPPAPGRSRAWSSLRSSRVSSPAVLGPAHSLSPPTIALLVRHAGTGTADPRRAFRGHTPVPLLRSPR